MSSRYAEGHYSEKCEESGKNIEEIDADLDAEIQAAIDLCPEVETAEEIIAELNAFNPNDDAPCEPEPAADDWLTDLREFARKHGPFSAAQIIQIVRELEVIAREASR